MPSGAIPYPFGDCRVCGDHATGVHYGVATCEGCKGFYKRSLGKAYKYRCFHGGKCTISPVERNRCKSCRYQRCIVVGMSVDGVKMGRIPKVDKERALEKHYGCGSREILSSGLVIPYANRRLPREPRDKPSNDRSVGYPSPGDEPNSPQTVVVRGRNQRKGGGAARRDARRRGGGVSRTRGASLNEPMDVVPYRMDQSGLVGSREFLRNYYADRGYNPRLTYDDARSNDSDRSYIRPSYPADDLGGNSPDTESSMNSLFERPISLRFAGESRSLRLEDHTFLKMSPDSRDPIRTAEDLRCKVYGEAMRLEEMAVGKAKSYEGRDPRNLSFDHEEAHNWEPRRNEEGWADHQDDPVNRGRNILYSPPVIKGLISQVVDPGQADAKFPTGFSRVNIYNASTASIERHAAARSPVSPDSVRSAHEYFNKSNRRRGAKYQNGADYATVGFQQQNSTADVARPDSEVVLERGEGYAVGAGCTQTKISEHCMLKGRQRRKGRDSVELETRGSINRKRSRSAEDLLCDIRTEEDKCRITKRQSLEWDDVELLHYESPALKDWEKCSSQEVGYSSGGENLAGKKKYELNYMVVDAGQRGKLRDAIDKICEDMAYGDVPILDLDCNAVTLNGESLTAEALKSFSALKRGFNSDSARIVEICDGNIQESSKKAASELHMEGNTTDSPKEVTENDESELRLNGEKMKTFQCEFGAVEKTEGVAEERSTGMTVASECDEESSLSGPMDSCCIEGKPAAKRRVVDFSAKCFYLEDSRNIARYCMTQGYIGHSGWSGDRMTRSDRDVYRWVEGGDGGDRKNVTMALTVRRRNSADRTDGEEAEPIRRSRIMNNVIRCIKVYADKLMNLIEIEIGIAVDEATGRRPLHRLNDPETVIGYEEVCVFWNDFMATLARGNSVIMGLCSNIPGFKQLYVSDQLTLIEQSYYMLWMVLYSRLFWDGECHIRVNSEAVYSRGWFNRFFPEPLVERMFYIAEEINHCQLTPIELIIVCALILTNSECGKLENPVRVKCLHDYYIDLLSHEIERNHPTNHNQVLIQLFQLLLMMAPMNQEQLEVVDTFSVDRPPTI